MFEDENKLETNLRNWRILSQSLKKTIKDSFHVEIKNNIYPTLVPTFNTQYPVLLQKFKDVLWTKYYEC
jgi:hypothetical protein